MAPNTGDFLDWLRDDMAALREDVGEVKEHLATLTVECKAASEPHRKPCVVAIKMGETLSGHLNEHRDTRKSFRGHVVGLVFRLIFAGIIGASAWAATYFAMARAAME